MKKFIILLGISLFLCQSAFCEEVVKQPQQTVQNENSYVLVNIEKAPASENKQVIKNTRSWFCINIIVNGKIKYIDADTNK